MARLIRTGLRDALPKKHALSYPLGAEVISEALDDVEQFDVLYLSFSRHPSDAVLGAVMNRNSWHITIHAVPAAESASVRKRLIKDALPRLKRWLQTPRKALWTEGHSVWHAVIDPFTDEMSFEEKRLSGP